MANDNTPVTDSPDQLGSLLRRLASKAGSSHTGCANLIAAHDALRRDDAAGALEHLAATHNGIPAELAPHSRALTAIALRRTGDTRGARAELADAWRDFPDFAALPAVLGMAAALEGDDAQAARLLAAALASDDPDGSLLLYRVLIGAEFRALSAQQPTSQRSSS